jgi:hypothetical protein
MPLRGLGRQLSREDLMTIEAEDSRRSRVFDEAPPA